MEIVFREISNVPSTSKVLSMIGMINCGYVLPEPGKAANCFNIGGSQPGLTMSNTIKPLQYCELCSFA